MFKLKENHSTVRTEIIAGLTTFMTMSYIVALNPNILTNYGADGGRPLWNAIYVATCISAAIGTMCMAFFANKPFVMAPGMGLNSFFAIVVSNLVVLSGASYLECYQSALMIILVEGILFIVLSLIKVRENIVNAIPLGIRLAISPAIGLMLMNIGFGSNATLIGDDGKTYYVLRDFFGALSPSVVSNGMGSKYPEMVLTVVTMLVGVFAIILFDLKKKKGAVLLGMLTSAAVYWAGQAIFLHQNPFASLQGASFIPPIGDMIDLTFFKFNFETLDKIGWFTVITLVITFCMIDMFDTIGSLMGAASGAGMTDKDGNLPGIGKALTSDAVGTVAGALTGTPTVTTFVESATGVEAGGRTGLTALVAAVMFLLCLFIPPIVSLIPASATGAALIYVGILMICNLKKVDFSDPYQIIPTVIMLIGMPITGSIGHGIGLAMITYTVMKLMTGKMKDVSLLTAIIAILFMIKFFAVI